MEGFTGIVHTAAASNLGQILNRVCIADQVPLVSIVRRPEQADMLRRQGAVHVCDSSAPDFQLVLLDALRATGATLAFDATGGGRLADDILVGMEAAASERASYSRYGSATRKQVYIYGALDLRPTELTRSYGLSWGAGGWLLTQFLQRIGSAKSEKLRNRVVSELTTTFKSHYTRTISLAQLLDPDLLRTISRKATGKKFLVDPTIS